MEKTQAAIAIIGGGASGLAAAVSAARAGAGPVLVLEKQDRVGRKLLATGNGRCNLENTGAGPVHYRTSAPEILARALEGMPPRQVLDFFAQCGLLCTEQQEGRIYPSCGQASMVLDVLRHQAAVYGVKEHCGFEVTGLERKAGGFQISARDGRCIRAKKIILAAGGLAAPKLGGSEGGYALAKGLGHTVLPLYACLAPLRAKAEGLAGLKGIRAVCGVSLRKKGRVLARERGEVQFADYGLSGIPVMQLAGAAAGRRPGEAELQLDFFPDHSTQELENMLHRRRKSGQYPVLECFLLGLLHKKLAVVLLRAAGLWPLSRPVASLTGEEISRLAAQLKGWSAQLEGPLGWDQAQATGGGVALEEINPVTFESRRCPGVYLTGELLDAAGDCGGFNLHWAFGSGLRAGQAAAVACNGKQ